MAAHVFLDNHARALNDTGPNNEESSMDVFFLQLCEESSIGAI